MHLSSGIRATSILDSIRRIVRALRLSSTGTERTLGISTAQLFVLQKLAEEPSLSINDLALRTLTHQSSVSVVVSKLVAHGWVARKASPTDARQVRLSLTAQGRALLRQARTSMQERLIEGIRLLPETDQSELSRLLQALIDASGLSEEPATLFFEDENQRTPRRKRSRNPARVSP